MYFWCLSVVSCFFIFLKTNVLLFQLILPLVRLTSDIIYRVVAAQLRGLP